MGLGTPISLGVIVVLVVWGVAIYNKLVTLKNRYVNAFSQIAVQLKRRYDLIPNLIETAKGYIWAIVVRHQFHHCVCPAEPSACALVLAPSG